MAIDASIALRQPQNQLNPMQSMGQAVQLGTNMLQARILGQEMAANQSISRAYQQATNPQTGQVDTNKLSALISQDPRAAWKLPQVQGQIADQRNKQVQYDKSQIELMMKKQNATGNFMAPIVADPGLGRMDMSQRIYSTIGDLVNNGLLDPQQAQQVAGQVPRDPMGQAQFVKSLWMRNLQGAEQLKAMMPQVQSMDLGGSTVTVGYDPMTGKPIQGTAMTFNKSMAPGEAATPVQVTNPDGSVTTTTKGNFAQGMGGGSAQGGIGGVTGPGAGYVAGIEEATKGATKRFNELQESAAGAQTAINGYDRALEVLNNTTSGPGANRGMTLAATLNTFGIPVASDNTKNYQELHKYLANAAASAASAAGYSGSDARMAAFKEGQPNAETMNPEALGKAISYVKALQSGVLAKNQAAQAYLESSGGDYSKLPRFETAWAKAFNPDVMELRNMTPEQQQTFIGGLSEAKKSKLMQSYQSMANLGAF